MKFIICKLNSYKKVTITFWKENKNSILVGVIATVVGGYILFLITTERHDKNISHVNGPEYFDTGTIPETHVVDATDEYRKIRELNAGSPISTFEEILGEYTFVNRLSTEVIEYVFVSPLFYVEAAVNLDKIIIFYSVTTRKSGFNPRYEFGPWHADMDKPLVVELGKTTYSELNKMFRGNPVYAAYTSGVNWFYYFESYYVGRPGNYQSYIFSTNQAGFYRSGSWDDEDALSDWPLLTPSHNIIDNRGLYSDKAISEKDWIKHRENAIINTYTVTVPYYGIENILEDLEKEYFGPNLEQVRLVN